MDLDFFVVSEKSVAFLEKIQKASSSAVIDSRLHSQTVSPLRGLSACAEISNALRLFSVSASTHGRSARYARQNANPSANLANLSCLHDAGSNPYCVPQAKPARRELKDAALQGEAYFGM